MSTNEKIKTGNQEDLLLFSYFRSSCSWRVRIALEYKGLKYDTVSIQLMRAEQQLKSEFVKLNPMGQVPALVVNGGETTMFQSIAILEYLEERYPEPHLLPKDLKQRAIVRQICELIASGIQPLQNLSTLHKLSDNEDSKLAWAQYWIRKGLIALEAILVTTSGLCCVGDNVTLADCCLVPQVANAHRFRVDIVQFPTIVRIDKHLSTIPAFQRAHASNQPDCPPEMYSKL